MCLHILEPVAWVLGNQELGAIQQGRRDPANRSIANTGKTPGIIGTALIVLVAAIAIIAVLSVTIVGDEISDTFSRLDS